MAVVALEKRLHPSGLGRWLLKNKHMLLRQIT